MGNCVSPESDESSFAVWNVDDGGNRVQPGRICLTDSHLVFLQKGGEPIRWPLSGLRRYGFDAELFSFESGRRCPTGSGVYAFKCPRAERLFNLLQERIQAQAPVRPNSMVDSPPSPQEMRTAADYLEPISIGAQVVSSVNFVNNVTPSARGPVYQNVPVQNVAAQGLPVAKKNSLNAAACLHPLGQAPGINYVVLDLDQPSEPPTPTSPTSPTVPTTPSTPTATNVFVSNSLSGSTSTIGVASNAFVCSTSSNVASTSSAAIFSALPSASSASSVATAPLNEIETPRAEGYAQIDFDRTMALSQVANRPRAAK